MLLLQSEIELKEAPLAAFKALLRYIYTGKHLFYQIKLQEEKFYIL